MRDLMEQQKVEALPRETFIRIVRRIAFAIGLGLLLHGIGLLVTQYGDGPTLMGLGGFLIGLAIPLGKVA